MFVQLKIILLKIDKNDKKILFFLFLFLKYQKSFKKFASKIYAC